MFGCFVMFELNYVFSGCDSSSQRMADFFFYYLYLLEPGIK